MNVNAPLRKASWVFAAVAMNVWHAPATRADLVFHFDPADSRTTFQGGWEDNRDGALPATQPGDPVGWIMDTRVPSSPIPNPDNGPDGWIDGQQGNGGNKPVLAAHPAGNVLNFLDSANNDTLLIFEDDLALTDGLNGLADNNFGSLVLAARIDGAASGNSYLIDFRDDAPVGGGSDAIDGFSLRYNHADGVLEGVIKQAVAVAVPVPTNEWFAAALTWDGPGGAAALSVETLDGVTTNSGAADANPLDADRARLGNTSNGSDGMLGQMGEVLFFNDVLDRTAEFSAVADRFVVPLPQLTIHRETGNVSITVPEGAAPLANVAGYSLTSASGALDPGQWKSIADNYDAGSPGPNQVDPDNEWTKLSQASLFTDLSELEFQQKGGTANGADFAAGSSTDLGNVWSTYYVEDVEMDLILDDNRIVPLQVVYEGNDDQGYDFGDLDFDGDIDEDDFRNAFLPNFDSDLSSVASVAIRYAQGDLDSNGRVTLEDFLLLNDAFLAANPGAASLSLQPVPEPLSATAAFCAAALALAARRRAPRCGLLLAAVVATSVLASESRGALVAHWRFDEASGAATLSEEVSGLSGTAANGVTGGATGQIDGAWAFDQPSQHYVDLTSHLDAFAGLTQGTISAWFRRPSASGAAVILSAYDDTVGSTEGRFFFENADLRWDVRDEGSGLNQEGGQINAGDASDDQWHHGVVTIDDAQNATLYVDGAVAATSLEPFWGQMGGLTGMAIGRNVDSGSPDGQWFFNGSLDDMQIYDEPLPAPAIAAIYEAGLNGQSVQITETELKVEVNTDTGEITIRNSTVLEFPIDAYRLASSANSLAAGGWNSLEDRDYEQQGAQSGWTELGAAANQLSEGFFGGNSVLAPNTNLSLGAAYRTDLDARDIVAEFHLSGTGPTSFLRATVEYVSGFSADFDGSGAVDGADLAQWEGDFAVNGDSDSNGDGRSDGRDLLAWQRQFGGGAAGQAAAKPVPEPSAGLLFAAALAIAGVRRVRHARGTTVAALLIAAIAWPAACRADAFVDRDYRLGDDPFEGAAAGGSGSLTFDSLGVNLAAFPGAINSGAYQDLAAFGGPTYANVGSNGLQRPGLGTTGAGSNPPLGMTFDGVNDRLATDISLNSPNQTWNSDLFPTGVDALYDAPSASGADGTGDGLYRPAFPHNYAGIFGRALQVWVRPELSGVRQDIVLDTEEHGLYITAQDTWGLQFDNAGVDTGVSVAATLDANGWAHAMVVSGNQDPVAGQSAFEGALLINGEAIAVRNEFYDNAADGLSVGANLAGDGNWFSGTLDDLQLMVWGENSIRGPAPTTQEPGYLGGADWGSLTADDNQWIALQLDALAQASGAAQIPAADVNLDGIVSGDGTGSDASDDVTALIGYWQARNLVGGTPVGDWNSRQQGDLNFDGITDIFDALALRDNLAASGSGSFDLSLLAGVVVPEPTAAWLTWLALPWIVGRHVRRATRG